MKNSKWICPGSSCFCSIIFIILNYYYWTRNFQFIILYYLTRQGAYVKRASAPFISISSRFLFFARFIYRCDKNELYRSRHRLLVDPSVCDFERRLLLLLVHQLNVLCLKQTHFPIKHSFSISYGLSFLKEIFKRNA